ncbi:hypothetical protein [Rufibacter roseus]|uniref:YiaAB two helix domain-containing protein n=1 Tax=Rufibacter roseus TaxID=1567108 RepID=A0ABW2DJH8_9BACT|nr:hypothetical protein [Rufibacter roseus]
MEIKGYSLAKKLNWISLALTSITIGVQYFQSGEVDVKLIFAGAFFCASMGLIAWCERNYQ